MSDSVSSLLEEARQEAAWLRDSSDEREQRRAIQLERLVAALEESERCRAKLDDSEQEAFDRARRERARAEAAEARLADPTAEIALLQAHIQELQRLNREHEAVCKMDVEPEIVRRVEGLSDDACMHLWGIGYSLSCGPYHGSQADRAKRLREELLRALMEGK